MIINDKSPRERAGCPFGARLEGVWRGLRGLRAKVKSFEIAGNALFIAKIKSNHRCFGKPFFRPVY